jgi:hypothetical protein
MAPGRVLLGKVGREMFNGSNSESCGRLLLELGSVKESSLPRLRAAIIAEDKPAKARRGKT